MDGLHLVPVATGVSDFEAKLLAARLGADGILWQTRGIVDSIYPFGGIDVLVPADQLDDARQILAMVAERAALEVGGPAAWSPNATAPDPPSAPDRRPDTRASRWFGLAAMGAIVAVLAVRVLALG